MPAWVEILLRSLGILVLVFILMRLGGKKHPVNLTPFHFVVLSVASVLAALTILTAVNFAFGVLAIGVWLLLPLLFDYLALRSKAVHDVMHGKETVLIKQGKIMEENMEKARLTGEELLKALRAKNVFSLADVEFAVLEASGEVNVMLKADKKPVTPHDLEWKVMPQTEPETIILDGNILHDPLTELGLTRGWLHTRLESAGVALDNVFLGQVNSAGELYLDLFDDAIQLPTPSIRELLFANLEKAQAELTTYSLETINPEAKAMYRKNADRLRALAENLRPYLLR